MRARSGRLAPARRVRSLATVTVVLDVVVVAAALNDWRAYSAAPNNAITVPGDDLGFVLVNLGYVGSSALRYVVLLALVAALMLSRGLTRRRRFAIAGALVAVEFCYVATTWTAASLNGAWCVSRVCTAAVSAALTAGLLVRLRRPTGPVSLAAADTA